MCLGVNRLCIPNWLLPLPAAQCRCPRRYMTAKQPHLVVVRYTRVLCAYDTLVIGAMFGQGAHKSPLHHQSPPGFIVLARNWRVTLLIDTHIFLLNLCDTLCILWDNICVNWLLSYFTNFIKANLNKRCAVLPQMCSKCKWDEGNSYSKNQYTDTIFGKTSKQNIAARAHYK